MIPTTDDDLPVEAGYTLWAPLYDDDGNPLTALEGPLLRSWIGPVEGRRVLDLGCGTGRHLQSLVDARAEIVAADLTLAMMALARRKFADRPIAWLRASLPGPLPFKSETFALVVMGLVAEHLADLDASLLEVARVLQPGGRLLLSALHPERTGQGQRARFIDPATGERRPIATVHRTVENYLRSAREAGLSLVEERTLVVPPELAEVLPRAKPYIGIPLGWAGCWRKIEGSTRVTSVFTR